MESGRQCGVIFTTPFSPTRILLVKYIALTANIIQARIKDQRTSRSQ